MAQNKELVQLVRYQFSLASFFNQSSASDHKIEESAQKYVDLCSEGLQRLYPNATVEIVESSSEVVEPYVEAWDQSTGELVPDLEELQIVDELCQRISESFAWLVDRKRVLVSKSQVYTDIPPIILRWACHNGLVEGAEKVTGFWDFPLDQLPQIREQIRFVNRSEISEVSPLQKQTAVCYLEEVKEVFVITLPQHVRFLVAFKQDYKEMFFRPKNSLFLICRADQKAQVEIEHFIDVEKWSHPNWNYAAYAKALNSRSSKHGIECAYQVFERDGRKEIDGISFRFTQPLLSQESTVQVLFDKTLRILSEVINEAELSLSGGPIWDEVYEQNEDRFCKEVLEPLLNKMGFVSVRYVHGDDEYGRDFIFAEETPFNELRHYGLQAKRGKISGGTKSDIDTILSQIQDSFAMPYTKEPKARSEIYISTMIIAISGEFTRNAIEKIRNKMPPYLVGSVYFWDKPKIRSLIAQYWGKEKV